MHVKANQQWSWIIAKQMTHGEILGQSQSETAPSFLWEAHKQTKAIALFSP